MQEGNSAKTKTDAETKGSINLPVGALARVRRLDVDAGRWPVVARLGADKENKRGDKRLE